MEQRAQSQSCLSYAETSDLAKHNAKLALVLLRRRKFAKGNRDKVRRNQLGIAKLEKKDEKTHKMPKKMRRHNKGGEYSLYKCL